MAKKDKVTFFCKHCGHETARWEGKCPGCNEWDALVEAPAVKSGPAMRGGSGGGGSIARAYSNPLQTRPKPLREHALEHIPRMTVSIGEFNRVLGGGIVPGGSVLVGGEPGIGKSTLLLQLLGAMADAQESALLSGAKVEETASSFLYITGEEAPSLCAVAARLGVQQSPVRAAGRTGSAGAQSIDVSQRGRRTESGGDPTVQGRDR